MLDPLAICCWADTQKKKQRLHSVQVSLNSGWLQRKAHPCLKPESFTNPDVRFNIGKAEERLHVRAQPVRVPKGKWRGLVDPVIQIDAETQKVGQWQGLDLLCRRGCWSAGHRRWYLEAVNTKSLKKKRKNCCLCQETWLFFFFCGGVFCLCFFVVVVFLLLGLVEGI